MNIFGQYQATENVIRYLNALEPLTLELLNATIRRQIILRDSKYVKIIING